jgi:hypothetical protein
VVSNVSYQCVRCFNDPEVWQLCSLWMILKCQKQWAAWHGYSSSLCRHWVSPTCSFLHGQWSERISFNFSFKFI